VGLRELAVHDRHRRVRGGRKLGLLTPVDLLLRPHPAFDDQPQALAVAVFDGDVDLVLGPLARPTQAQVVRKLVSGEKRLEDDRREDLVLRAVLELLLSDVFVVDQRDRITLVRHRRIVSPDIWITHRRLARALSRVSQHSCTRRASASSARSTCKRHCAKSSASKRSRISSSAPATRHSPTARSRPSPNSAPCFRATLSFTAVTRQRTSRPSTRSACCRSSAKTILRRSRRRYEPGLHQS